MSLSSKPSDKHDARIFTAVVFPDEDLIDIHKSFCDTWKDFLEPGDCYAVDPGENVFCLKLNKGDDGANFTKGVINIAKFYGIDDMHTAEFEYIGADIFNIRIYTVDGAEIQYPIGKDSDAEPNVCYQSKLTWWKVEVMDVERAATTPLAIPNQYVRDVLSNDQEVLHLIDEGGEKYASWLLRGTKGDSQWSIEGGWYAFCKENPLSNGDVLKIWSKGDAEELFVEISRGPLKTKS